MSSMSSFDKSFFVDGVDIQDMKGYGRDVDGSDDEEEYNEEQEEEEDSEDDMVPNYRMPAAAATNSSPHESSSVRSQFLEFVQHKQGNSPQQQMQQDEEQSKQIIQKAYKSSPTGASVSPHAKKQYPSTHEPVQSDFLRDMLAKEKRMALKRQAEEHNNPAAARNRQVEVPWDDMEDVGGEDYGEADYGGGEECDEDDEEEGGGGSRGGALPVAMPEEFYQGVDSFLRSGPPPSLALKGKKKSEMESATSIMQGVGKADKGRVIRKSQGQPANKATSGDNKDVASKPAFAQVRSKISTGRDTKNASKAGAGRNGGGSLDHSLLQEAFSYTAKLMQEAIADEAQEAADAVAAATAKAHSRHSQSGGSGTDRLSDMRQYVDLGGNNNSKETGGSYVQRSHPRSAPVNRESGIFESGHGGGGGTGVRRSSGTGIGAGGPNAPVIRKVGGKLVKKLRNQTAAYGGADRAPAGVSNGPARRTNVLDGRADSSFDTSARGSQDDGTGLKNKLDYKGLVANFETGSTLQKLKDELARSQASAKNSEDCARQLMSEANYHPGR